VNNVKTDSSSMIPQDFADPAIFKSVLPALELQGILVITHLVQSVKKDLH
jgi:hypothetical protein